MFQAGIRTLRASRRIPASELAAVATRRFRKASDSIMRVLGAAGISWRDFFEKKNFADG
jgi:hypothetical protein